MTKNKDPQSICLIKLDTISGLVYGMSANSFTFPLKHWMTVKGHVHLVSCGFLLDSREIYTSSGPINLEGCVTNCSFYRDCNIKSYFMMMSSRLSDIFALEIFFVLFEEVICVPIHLEDKMKGELN